jgi:hypothetical protein
MMQMKTLLGALALVATAQQASAFSLNTRCELWNSKEAYEINMILVQHLGTPMEKLGISASTLTMVESLNKELIFSDDLSHLNVKSQDGLFEQTEKAFYPVRPGHDPLNPKPEYKRIRKLSLDLQLLPVDKDGVVNRVTRINLKQLDPTLPDDSTFTGDATITVDGKTKKMSANCLLYVDWSSYARATRKTN